MVFGRNSFLPHFAFQLACLTVSPLVAKNITLAGIKSLTVNDHEPATWLDLATNFYLTPEHVTTAANRAEACAPRLGELNPYAIHTLASFSSPY